MDKKNTIHKAQKIYDEASRIISSIEDGDDGFNAQEAYAILCLSVVMMHDFMNDTYPEQGGGGILIEKIDATQQMWKDLKIALRKASESEE